MKNILLIAVLMLATISGAFAKEVKVKGYTKKDGTKVAGTRLANLLNSELK